MQTVFRRAISIGIWASTILLAAGCSKTETPPVAPPSKSTLPQSGSTFRFERHDFDSNGRAIPGSEGESAITFVKTDLSFRSRDSVVAVADKNSSEVGYFRYEGTTGISIFTKRIEDYGIPGAWVTLPINGNPPVQTTYDTTVKILGSMVPVTIAVTAVPMETEIFDVGNERLDAQKTRVQVTVKQKSDGVEVLRNIHTIWYAPKIGYFAKEDITLIVGPSLGVPILLHTVRELKSYILEMA